MMQPTYGLRDVRCAGFVPSCMACGMAKKTPMACRREYRGAACAKSGQDSYIALRASTTPFTTAAPPSFAREPVDAWLWRRHLCYQSALGSPAPLDWLLSATAIPLLFHQNTITLIYAPVNTWPVGCQDSNGLGAPHTPKNSVYHTKHEPA